MRLIDADELVKAIENENPGLSISGTVEKFARTTQVKMQPTVEAIPVEWIEEWQNKNEWKYESYFTMRDGVPKYAIECMIEDWVKENG